MKVLWSCGILAFIFVSWIPSVYSVGNVEVWLQEFTSKEADCCMGSDCLRSCIYSLTVYIGDSDPSSKLSNEEGAVIANTGSNVTFTTESGNPFLLTFQEFSMTMVLYFRLSRYFNDVSADRPSPSFHVGQGEPSRWDYEPQFTKEIMSSNVATLIFQYRIRCNENYYRLCDEFCKPVIGQYSCSRSGKKECAQGWKGADCNTMVTTSTAPSLSRRTSLQPIQVALTSNTVTSPSTATSLSRRTSLQPIQVVLTSDTVTAPSTATSLSRRTSLQPIQVVLTSDTVTAPSTATSLSRRTSFQPIQVVLTSDTVTSPSTATSRRTPLLVALTSDTVTSHRPSTVGTPSRTPSIPGTYHVTRVKPFRPTVAGGYSTKEDVIANLLDNKLVRACGVGVGLSVIVMITVCICLVKKKTRSNKITDTEAQTGVGHRPIISQKKAPVAIKATNGLPRDSVKTTVSSW